MGVLAVLAGLALASGTGDAGVSGRLAGQPFHLTEAHMDADGMSSMRLSGVGEDRIRPYKFRLKDRKGFGDYREITIRIQADWDRRLDGTTIDWMPYPDDSPDDRRQKTLDGRSPRFARGITRIDVITQTPGRDAQMVTYRDRIRARIEFGQLQGGFLPGRLRLELPDGGKTRLSGTFRAAYRVRHELP